MRPPSLLAYLRAPLIVLAVLLVILAGGVAYLQSQLHLSTYDVLVVWPSTAIGVAMMAM